MSTKTLSVLDDVYGLLASHKRPGESFSEVIRRLATKKGSIMEYAGAWSDLRDGDVNDMKNTLHSFREAKNG